MKNYPAALKYLMNHLPMYQRVGAAAYKKDLQNTIAVCDVLDNPHHRFKSIHIAGTNGKGSVAHFLASVLQFTGLKVGLYTSPHFKDYRERIKVNGRSIGTTYIADFVAKYRSEFDKINPSFFEMTMGMAFAYFADEKVDIAIIETGMGGRLDSTNVITPIASIITNIGLDHTHFLGNTLEKIAAEKGGIIKNEVPVVIGEWQQETAAVFEKKASEMQAPIYFSNEVKVRSNFLKRYPAYQQKNIKTVLKTVAVLQQLKFKITPIDIENGIANMQNSTGLLGRWQTLSTAPLTICDMAHNPAGIHDIIEQIEKTPHQNLHVVFGMNADKDVEQILQLLPQKATYYFCQANLPRAIRVEELQRRAHAVQLVGETYSNVKRALEAAQENAQKKDLVFVGGSAFVVAEVV